MAGLRLGLYSVAGVSNSKAACFVFEEGADEPTLVVKVMPDAAFADRLRHETDVVETFRGLLGPGSAAAEALPLRPLFAGTAAEDFVVVQPVDPMAVGTGLLTEPAAALSLAARLSGGDDHDRSTLGRSGHPDGDGLCSVCLAASPSREGRCRRLAHRAPPGGSGGSARPAVRRAR